MRRGETEERHDKARVNPDQLTQGFWDAANEGRLVVQNCTACDRLQFPPFPACDQCGSGDSLEWKQMSGRGKIYNYGVVHDCPIALLKEDLPFNLAVIMLDDDPEILITPISLGSRSTRSRWGLPLRSFSRRPQTARRSPSGRWRVRAALRSRHLRPSQKGEDNDYPDSSRIDVQG